MDVDEDADMTTPVEAVPSIWRSVQGDAELLVGLTYGEFEDFCVGLMELIVGDEKMRRTLPVRLVVNLSEIAKKTETMLAWVSELTRLPQVDAFLDKLAGIDPDD